MSLEALPNISYTNCLVGVAAVVTTVILWREASRSRSRVPLPPGPPVRWFWDSAMPTVNVARSLADLVAEYGPVVTLCEGTQITIVIGRADAAAEIMEKEGAATADRPRMIAAGEILAQNLRLLHLNSGEQFRRYRKAAHAHLHPKATTAYQDIQFENARNVVLDVLDNPNNLEAHAERYSASVMLRVTYGRSTSTSKDDPEVKNIYQANRYFQLVAHPGAFLVDRIPLLKYVPGYGRRLKEYRDFEAKIYHDHMRRVESQLETNQGGTSFMKSLLENVHEHGLSRDEMAYLAGDLFGAGSGTTASAIICMILAAACYPEAQRRVQEQLDMIVGKERLPTFDDSELLTQVHAFVLEAHRWRPVTPIGFSHRASRDIIWRGQRIPKGATILGCQWAICQDPVVFPEPDKFDPQRWIDGNGQLRNDISSYTYGFGRRICPGLHVANKSLYINLALLLWSFYIVERTDTPIDKNAFTDSVVSVALPFKVDFIPRMEESRLREMMSEPAM